MYKCLSNWLCLPVFLSVVPTVDIWIIGLVHLLVSGTKAALLNVIFSFSNYQYSQLFQELDPPIQNPFIQEIYSISELHNSRTHLEF